MDQSYFDDTSDLYQHKVPTFDEFAQRSRAVGAGTELYLVQRDLPIRSLAELRVYYDQQIAGRVPKLSADTVSGLPIKVSGDEQLGIGYCVSDEFQAFSNGIGGTVYDSLVGGMTIAGQAWAQGGNVWFKHVAVDNNCSESDSPSGVYIKVIPWNQNSSCWGCSANAISWFTGAGGTALAASDTLSHEIGHSLGFAHENFRPDWSDACPAIGSVIGLTPTIDLASIMLVNQGDNGEAACDVAHPPDWCLCPAINETNTAVSSGDRLGAAILYGLAAAAQVSSNL